MAAATAEPSGAGSGAAADADVDSDSASSVSDSLSSKSCVTVEPTKRARADAADRLAQTDVRDQQGTEHEQRAEHDAGAERAERGRERTGDERAEHSSGLAQLREALRVGATRGEVQHPDRGEQHRDHTDADSHSVPLDLFVVFVGRGLDHERDRAADEREGQEEATLAEHGAGAGVERRPNGPAKCTQTASPVRIPATASATATASVAWASSWVRSCSRRPAKRGSLGGRRRAGRRRGAERAGGRRPGAGRRVVVVAIPAP